MVRVCKRTQDSSDARLGTCSDTIRTTPDTCNRSTNGLSLRMEHTASSGVLSVPPSHTLRTWSPFSLPQGNSFPFGRKEVHTQYPRRRWRRCRHVRRSAWQLVASTALQSATTSHRSSDSILVFTCCFAGFVEGCERYLPYPAS